ncbi:hypothetical protein EV426DRAFT_614127 [Tirmania nivea]|nr:hypothetical protein EV426DRAFT_614127 [Tirmania nivea]
MLGGLREELGTWVGEYILQSVTSIKSREGPNGAAKSGDIRVPELFGVFFCSILFTPFLTAITTIGFFYFLFIYIYIHITTPGFGLVVIGSVRTGFYT